MKIPEVGLASGRAELVCSMMSPEIYLYVSRTGFPASRPHYLAGVLLVMTLSSSRFSSFSFPKFPSDPRDDSEWPGYGHGPFPELSAVLLACGPHRNVEVWQGDKDNCYHSSLHSKIVVRSLACQTSRGFALLFICSCRKLEKDAGFIVALALSNEIMDMIALQQL